MRDMRKTKFSALSALELAVIKEPLRIISGQVVVGHFVPALTWELLRLVITGVEWDDIDELGHEALAIVQDTPDAPIA